jgi:hypothetical protein
MASVNGPAPFNARLQVPPVRRLDADQAECRSRYRNPESVEIVRPDAREAQQCLSELDVDDEVVHDT